MTVRLDHATAHREKRVVPHAHDRTYLGPDDDAERATPEAQPTARSGPTSPANADDARVDATHPGESRSGLTRQEQSEPWPLG